MDDYDRYIWLTVKECGWEREPVKTIEEIWCEFRPDFIYSSSELGETSCHYFLFIVIYIYFDQIKTQKRNQKAMLLSRLNGSK